jgi:hypothetical protein
VGLHVLRRSVELVVIDISPTSMGTKSMLRSEK